MISVSCNKQYLPRYLLISFIFTLLLLACTALGFWLTAEQEPRSHTSAPVSESPIIVIDPGHGGEDGGAIGVNGIYEKDINLAIAEQVNDILQAAGISTVLTRSDDRLLYDPNSDYQGHKKVQDLATRRKIAESYDSAIFVSIHMNAFPEEKYSGLQVYYSPNNPESKTLAEYLQTNSKVYLLPDNTRTIKKATESIYLLNRLRCPAILVECGFLSNPQECKDLSSPEYQQKIAFAISLSILEHLSENDT